MDGKLATHGDESGAAMVLPGGDFGPLLWPVLSMAYGTFRE